MITHIFGRPREIAWGHWDNKSYLSSVVPALQENVASGAQMFEIVTKNRSTAMASLFMSTDVAYCLSLFDGRYGGQISNQLTPAPWSRPNIELLLAFLM